MNITKGKKKFNVALRCAWCKCRKTKKLISHHEQPRINLHSQPRQATQATSAVWTLPPRDMYPIKRFQPNEKDFTRVRLADKRPLLFLSEVRISAPTWRIPIIPVPVPVPAPEPSNSRRSINVAQQSSVPVVHPFFRGGGGLGNGAFLERSGMSWGLGLSWVPA